MPGFSITRNPASGPAPNNTSEFHRSHRWIIENLGFPVGAPMAGAPEAGAPEAGFTQTRAGSGGGGGGPSSGGGGATMALFARDLQLPSLELEEEKINSPSLVYKIAKRANWKDCTVKFYDVWGLHKLFREWQKLIWNPQSGIRPASDYKGEPKFALTDGTGEVTQRYTLKGAFPKNVSHGDLSYTDSSIKLLIITYSYDFAEIELLDNAS